MKEISDIVTLRDGENIILSSKPSKVGLIVTWISIPGVYLISFLLIYLPRMIKVAFSQAVKDAIISSLGVNSIKEVNLMDYITAQILKNIPKPLIILGMIPFILLTLAWLGWCIVMTFRYFRYSVAVTDIRVIGKAANEEMDEPLENIVNVFIEQGQIEYQIHKARSVYPTV